MAATFKRALLAIVAAVALGPLVAAIAMWLLLLVTTVVDPSGFLPSLKDAIVHAPKLILTLTIAAYRAGTVIALIAGVLVALWMLWRPVNVAVVLVASVAAALAELALSEPAVFVGTASREDLWIMPPLAAVAGAACWLLLRRFARPA